MPDTRSAVGGKALHGLLQTHAGRDDQIFGIVDSARDPRLAAFVFTEYMEERRWLFEDYAAEHMRSVAPYLVPVAFTWSYPYPRSEYLDLWASRLFTNAGVLLTCGADVGPLHRHLRRIFRVSDEQENQFFFRYYDPRVLRVYLPTCTAAEARQFFGPIRKLIVEAEEPGRMLIYSPGRSGVHVEEEPI